jgi:GDP-D-mannose 3',5'-epimerase
MDETFLVCGAGGFIGGHLVRRLQSRGQVRAVDSKPLDQWCQKSPAAENHQADLSLIEECRQIMTGATSVFNLAADMGGMGYIETNKAACMLNVLINTHLLMAARDVQVRRFFFASSACVYAANKQLVPQIAPLKEADAYPAMPEDGYGWEKLFGERMCRHFREDFGLETRVARYHNVYGPNETFEGGREKAPAAICRKIAQAKLTGHHEIEIWGDGEQTRSFTYIDDCLKGTTLVTDGTYADALNVGSSEMVTINQLVELVEQIAGIRVQRRYNLGAPRGVRGRNSDNSLIRSIYDWEPSTTLQRGLEVLYPWIHDQLARRS